MERRDANSVQEAESELRGQRNVQFVPLTRRYQPDPAALDALIVVLYELLLDAPVNRVVEIPRPVKPTCICGTPE